MEEEPTTPLRPFQVWLLAARPRTLPAAAAPVIVGSALAYHDGTLQPLMALAALLAALLLQVGANLANDVFDYYRGADSTSRLGPLRVTQAGLLTPRQVLVGMWLTFGLAIILGFYLAFVGEWVPQRAVVVVLIGLSAILAAIAYTGGPFPYGYYGLGDLSVFLFFGVAAVVGTYYIQALAITPLAVWASLPMGFLITAILVVNNLRDIDTDREAGKKTLAVRLGVRGTRYEFLLCVIGAFVIPLILVALGSVSAWLLLAWMAAPLAIYWTGEVFRQQGRPLNRSLAGTGQLALVYALLFSAGLVIG